MWHKHDWVKIKETYAPPSTNWTKITGDGYNKIVQGVTTILWECSICNKIRREEMLGKEVVTADENRPKLSGND